MKNAFSAGAALDQAHLNWKIMPKNFPIGTDVQPGGPTSNTVPETEIFPSV